MSLSYTDLVVVDRARGYKVFPSWCLAWCFWCLATSTRRCVDDDATRAFQPPSIQLHNPLQPSLYLPLFQENLHVKSANRSIVGVVARSPNPSFRRQPVKQLHPAASASLETFNSANIRNCHLDLSTQLRPTEYLKLLDKKACPYCATRGSALSLSASVPALHINRHLSHDESHAIDNQLA